MSLIQDSVHVWRTPEGGCHIQWQTSDPDTQVSVQALADGARVVMAADGLAAEVFDLSPLESHRFQLSDQYGAEIAVGERRLGFVGTPNFRDFGGYVGADGRRLRWGHFFRSGQLSGLSDADVQLLASLQLDFLCDFRRVDEQNKDPNRLPEDKPPRTLSLPITPGSSESFFEAAGSGQGPDLHSFMVDINRDFATAQSAAYRRMFEEILAVDDARFLVHCAAGKDRTGFAAAVILSALGVSRQTIMADYLLTRAYFDPQAEVARLQRKYDLEHMQAQAVLPMLEVHEAYLAAAFDSIDQHYGGMNAYLAAELGVDEQAREYLRERYLLP